MDQKETAASPVERPAAALTSDQRQALGEAISEYFEKLDSDEGIRTPEGRILRAFDYCDSHNVDDLIDRAILPALATSANETGAEGATGLAHELWAAAQLAPGEGIEDGVRRIEAIVSRSPATGAAPPALPIELNSVAETLTKGNGFWRSCSGCHETNEGHETGHFPYSKILKCHLGGGCSECGGIGAVWDDTDYEAMARDLGRTLTAPPHPGNVAAAPADERAATFEEWLASLSPQRRALIGDVRDARMGWEAARAAASPAAPDGDEAEVEAYVIDRMGHLLAEIALILNGEPKPRHRPSYHDLPDKVRALQCEVELLRAAASPAAKPALYVHKFELDQMQAGARSSTLAVATPHGVYSHPLFSVPTAASPAAEPVATVEVGGMEHGPFTFQTTPYGADTLPKGVHSLYAAPQPAQADAPAETRPTAYHFHRFVDGQERAEGILIERALTLEAAVKQAVKLCPKQPMTVTVLVHAPAWSGTLHGGALAKRVAPDAPAEAREPHSDDVAVDSFATEMKHKLALARAKGRGGWETCSPADLSRMLREHVEKGDPRDVANFCMMLWHHGSPIVGAAGDAGKAAPFGWAPPKGGNYFTRNETSAKRIGGLVPVYTAPPAASVVSLTDEQREAIKFAVTWFDQSVLPDTPYSGYSKALRELLNGADR